jgi:sugar phosphate isomerase/epimerase
MRTLAKIFTVTRDEYDLIEDFIIYYGSIFGYNNVVIIDNGSTHEKVLDIYKYYTNHGVEIVYESNYKGNGQGNAFTKHMLRYKEKAQYLIGLDTDEFIFLDNHELDPTAIRRYLHELDPSITMFSINMWYSSIPSACSSDYIDGKHNHPVESIEWFYLMDTPTHQSKKFYRGSEFIWTGNGNHSGITSKGGVATRSRLSLFHFTSTGTTRSFERSKNICIAYGYINKEDSDEVIIHKLKNKHGVPGFHRVHYLYNYLSNPEYQKEPVNTETFINGNAELVQHFNNEKYTVIRSSALSDQMRVYRKRDALIGFTGFVGSTLNKMYPFSDKFNTKNIQHIDSAIQYRWVVFSAAYASKWYANLYPEKDNNHIDELISIMDKITCERLILISTIDAEGDHQYGRGRRRLEEKALSMNGIVVRIPALYGFGLKKNALYDVINRGSADVNPDSTYQWYNTHHMVDDLYTIIYDSEFSGHGTLVKLYPRGYRMCDIVEIDKLNKEASVISYNEPPTIEMDHSEIMCYRRVMEFGRLSISTLVSKDVLTLGDKYGIGDYEIAPYSFFGDDIEWMDKTYDISNMYSIQSALYPSTVNLFESPEEFEKLMDSIIDFCGRCGIKIIVFGSPKNRRKPEGVETQIAVDIFHRLGERAASKGVTIGIEPNAIEYGCNFITNSVEGAEFVTKVNSKGVGLHLDTGCMVMSGENPYIQLVKFRDMLVHVHLSMPYLKRFEPGCFEDVLNFLITDPVYKGHFTIEMGPAEVTLDEIDSVLYKTCNMLMRLYKTDTILV